METKIPKSISTSDICWIKWYRN